MRQESTLSCHAKMISLCELISKHQARFSTAIKFKLFLGYVRYRTEHLVMEVYRHN